MKLRPARLRLGLSGAMLAALTYPYVIFGFVAFQSSLRRAFGDAVAPDESFLSTTDLWNRGAAQILATLLLALVFVSFRGDSTETPLRGVLPRKLSFPTLGLCFLTGLALQLPLAELCNLAQEVVPIPYEWLQTQDTLLSSRSVGHAAALAFSIVLAAPACEEIVFRRWLFAGLQGRYTFWLAALASAAIFAVAHGFMFAVFAFVLAAGVVLAWIAERTGSVVYSCAAHLGVNLAAVAVRPSWLPIRGYNVLTSHVEHISFGILSASVAVVGLGLFAIARLSASSSQPTIAPRQELH